LVAEGNQHGVLEFGCAAGAKAKIKVSPKGGFRYSAAATVGSARTSTILVRDLDTVRVRNAIRAEILAILRDMENGPAPNAGAGARS
jgi:hypothetical protein